MRWANVESSISTTIVKIGDRTFNLKEGNEHANYRKAKFGWTIYINCIKYVYLFRIK